MKKEIYLIILLLVCRICTGQNLVPNGGFEQYYGCPSNFNQLDSAYDWFNPSIDSIGGSPDYYNQCALGYVGIPQNPIGYQLTNSGNAYSGIYLSQVFLNVREYIEVALSSPLIATCYHFEMYVNLGDKSKYTTDAIGVYFSDTIISNIPNGFYLPLSTQINNTTGNIFDSLSWTLVSGNYLAQGGENYLIIGNFKNDSLTPLILANPSSAFASVYVFIDDVSLTPCTAVNYVANDNSFNIYPIPFNNVLNLHFKNDEPLEFILYDIASRKLLQKKITNSVSLNTEQLAKGLYLYEVRERNGLCKKGKVVKD